MSRLEEYLYAGKTKKVWAGSCRQFVMRLEDGSFHRANFRYK